MAREPRRDRGEREESEFIDKLVHINRVAKVVKGGRRFGFAALVVVGDQKGRVGFGHGKAREVPEAIRKATEAAKRNLTRVPLREGRTLHHDVYGRHGAGKVQLRAAPAGTGIIAGGPMRAVFESLGMQDVVAKSLGSSNPYNMVRATFDALKHQDSPRSVAARRSIKVSTLQARRREEGVEATAGIKLKKVQSVMAAKKTIKVEQIGSPIRRDGSQRATLIGLGLNKIGRVKELQDNPSTRGMIDKVGASRARGRREVNDEAQSDRRPSRRQASSAPASGAASDRARARPADAAARARPRVPACASRASKAARCRCIAACRSAASAIPRSSSR